MFAPTFAEMSVKNCRVRPIARRMVFAPKRDRMLERLAAGLTMREIAAELGVSYKTVSESFRRARKSRGVENNAALVAMLRPDRAEQPQPLQKRT